MKTITLPDDNEWANPFLSVIITAANGGRTISVSSPEDLEFLARDPLGFAASSMGLSVDNYKKWIEYDGVVQCARIKKDGKQCRNPVHGHYSNAVEWLEAQGRLCALHKKEDE